MFGTVLPSCLGRNILTLPAVADLTINTLRLTCRKMAVVHVQSSCASFYLADLSGVNSFRLPAVADCLKWEFLTHREQA